MIPLWSNLSFHHPNLSPFISSFVKIISLLKTSKATLDPSHFLQRLHQLITKSGNTQFQLFAQQDAAEMLTYILDAFCSESVNAKNMLITNTRQLITCNICQQTSLTEESAPLLQLAVSNSIQTSLDSFLSAETLDNFECNFCSTR